MNEAFTISGYSTTERLLCMISGDEIYQTDYYAGSKKLIGKTIAAYNELEETTNEYYNKLVELGIVVPPMSNDEMINKMQSSMDEMAGLISMLANEIKELKSGGAKQDIADAERDISERKSTGRNGKSTASVTGNAG